MSREPLQYLLGTAPFRRIELLVGPGVFIPRPETELVAGHALDRLPQGGTLLDVCTGSGAIALAAADERPDATVIATEVSGDALTWAGRNRDRLRLPVEILACDLFAGLPVALRGGVDVVVGNPPYVDTAERDRLPADVADHEPPEALFAPERGTSVIERIARGAPEWLKPGGWLVLEIGETQGPEVVRILVEGGYADVSVEPDLTGRDRIALGRRAA